MPRPEETKRARFDKLIAQLKLTRLTWEPQWRDIGDHLSPNRLRFLSTDNNKGDRRNLKIYNTAPIASARVIGAGLMAGITSPSRPWMKLGVSDEKKSSVGSVKGWLDSTTTKMLSIFGRCGVYQTLPELYSDVAEFASGAIFVEENLRGKVVDTYSFPIGSYWVGLDSKLKPAVWYREFPYTVRQILDDFQTDPDDWSNISDYVKTCADNGQLETEVECCHIVYPNPDYKEGAWGPRGKRFASCYFEKNKSTSNAADTNKFLRESGYRLFPILFVRWKTAGNDVYGTDCPGMESLGDCKQLQVMEKKSLQIIALHAQPPLKAPVAMQKQVIALIPGQVSYVDEAQGAGGQKVEPLYQIQNPALDKLEAKIQNCVDRIDDSHFVNLFLMLAHDDRTQPPTAEEIVERRSEKMVALGPALERFNRDLLDPLVDLVFDYGLAQGIWDEAPEELQGEELKVEYISVMAQAQKMTGLTANDKLVSLVGSIVEATQDPSKADIVDFAELVRDSAEQLGTAPNVVRSKDVMQQMEAQKQAAAQANAKLAAAEQASGAAKNLAAADMGGDNALTRLAEQGQAGALAQAAA